MAYPPRPPAAGTAGYYYQTGSHQPQNSQPGRTGTGAFSGATAYPAQTNTRHSVSSKTGGSHPVQHSSGFVAGQDTVQRDAQVWQQQIQNFVEGHPLSEEIIPETGPLHSKICQCLADAIDFDNLGSLLELSPAARFDIKFDVQTSNHRGKMGCQGVLRRWRTKYSSNATFGRLVATLNQHEYQQLASALIPVIESGPHSSNSHPRTWAKSSSPALTASIRPAYTAAPSQPLPRIQPACTQPVPPQDQLFHASEACLQQTVSERTLATIAKSIIDWREIAPYLGINNSDEMNILKNQPHSYPSQKLEMLRTWAQKSGSQATYLALARGVEEAGNRRLAEDIAGLARGQTQPAPREMAVVHQASVSVLQQQPQQKPRQQPQPPFHPLSQSRMTVPSMPAVQVADSHLLEISRDLSDWQTLAYSLLDHYQVDSLSYSARDNQWSLRDTCYQVLLQWKQSKGYAATYGELYEQLVENSRQDIADRLPQMATEEKSRLTAEHAALDLD